MQTELISRTKLVVDKHASRPVWSHVQHLFKDKVQVWFNVNGVGEEVQRYDSQWVEEALTAFMKTRKVIMGKGRGELK